MSEVLIRFESEELEGIVAVGTYLMDAAKRLGVGVDDRCRRESEPHHCSMKVSKGADLLSEPTSTETDLLGASRISKGERLSCQAKIEKNGEVTIMAVEKPEKEEPKAEEHDPAEDFKKEFESMPLEKKIASLVELEAIALGETFSFVLNSPYEAAGKAMDFLAEFGWKKDKADQEAKKPEEHAAPEKEESGSGARKKGKSSAKDAE